MTVRASWRVLYGAITKGIWSTGGCFLSSDSVAAFSVGYTRQTVRFQIR